MLARTTRIYPEPRNVGEPQSVRDAYDQLTRPADEPEPEPEAEP